ncbi:protein Mea [Acidimicrobiaceae bacterium]|nr:protein Mea [Acidimicrobiaceae bacterium]
MERGTRSASPVGSTVVVANATSPGFETDLLEYEDIFDGSVVIESRTKQLINESWSELNEILSMGGAFEVVDVLKSKLVSSMSSRTSRIEKGDQKVIGVNAFTQTASSPLGGVDNILKLIKNRRQMINDVRTWRKSRNQGQVDSALKSLQLAARDGSNLMPASIELAKAGGTTGEWSQALREIFGEYRAPTGVGGISGRHGHLLNEVQNSSKRSLVARRDYWLQSQVWTVTQVGLNK